MLSRRSVALFALSAILLIATAFAEGAPKKKETKSKSGECDFKGSNWKNSLSQTEKMWAGSLARLCAQTLLHPLDTIRTRRQVMPLLCALLSSEPWLIGSTP